MHAAQVALDRPEPVHRGDTMELQNRTVAVTGATGMLGSYLCRALLREGARVVGVVRNPDKAAFLAHEGVEFRKADLLDRAALTRAFRGCDAVVANAALYAVLNQRWEDNYLPNKQGTENVYEALADAGVKRAVHISTFGVYRWRLGGPAIDESSPVLNGERREGGAYRATKQMSEALAFQISRARGISTTAVRPAGIYGARDSNTMPWFRALMRLPILPIPTFRFPFVYAGDVANAVVGALRNDASGDKAYLIAGRPDTLYDFVHAWRQAAGKKNWLIPLPVPTGVRIDCRAAERDIGFVNRSYVAGLAETFADEASFRADRVLAAAVRPKPQGEIGDTAAR
jgi:nucleoside-diphosphate-sugar epimerase